MFSLAMWLGGGMLYLWIISLIFYRYTFFTMSPSDLAPPYWINMGAAAISTLAGTLLVSAAPQSPAIAQILPFVRGLTFMWRSLLPVSGVALVQLDLGAVTYSSSERVPRGYVACRDHRARSRRCGKLAL